MTRIDALLVVPVPVGGAGSSARKRRNMKRRRSGGYQKRERTRGRSPRTGTAAAAAAVAVLGLAALSPHSTTVLSKCGGSGTGTAFAAAAAADRNTRAVRRLPQRRVRTPRRAVPYPPAHPLTRHLEISVEDGHYSSEDGGQEAADDDNEATTTNINDDKDQDDEEEDGDGDGDDRDRSSSGSSSSTSSPAPTPPPGPIPEPIRIVPILTAATKRHLTKYQQSYVLDTVLQPAIDAWSDIISLVRVQGNLTLDRTQLWDGVSCGPGLDGSGTPSAVVPEHHFHDYVHNDVNATTTATATAPGVPNADLVVYIELGYRQMQQQDDNVEDQDDTPEESTNVDEESKHPGFVRGSDPRYKDAGFEALPTEKLLPVEDAPPPPSSSTESSSAALSTASISLNISSAHSSLTGIIDPDVSASLASAATTAAGGGISRPTRHVEHPKCSPAYLASATHCSTDQFDRPTHGMIHFCVDPKTFFSSETDDVRRLQLTRLTAMHELGHILGFNIQSLAHFRESDGTPRTPRIPALGGTNASISATEPWVVGDVADVKVECTGILPPGPGNGNSRKKRRRRAILPLPSRSTLRFRTIRGGLRVADVVLPTVRTVVRNHFSCDTLVGAELEGEPYSVERQQDPWLLTTALPSPESETDAADTISSAVTTDEGKRRRAEGVGDSKKNADGRDRRGDFDFLEHGVTVDQDGISDVDPKEYYNDDSDIGFCIGDHWSRRIFKTDLMNPVITDVILPRPESLHSSSGAIPSLLPAISPLTLAFLSDSGWYHVDFALASPGSIWGRGAGCPFVNEKCVMGNGKIRSGNSAFFCDDPKGLPSLSPVDVPRGSLRERDSLLPHVPEEEWSGCTFDMLRKASCALAQYSEQLPEEFQYFKQSSSFLKRLTTSDIASVAGTEPSLDYCPVYDPPISAEANEDTTLCTNPKAARHSRIKEMEIYGAGSRCVTGRVDGRKMPLCVSVACVVSDQSLRLNVDGVWKKCQFAGQVLDIWPRDKVICPDVRLVCPAFWCPRDCLGAGGIDENGSVVDGICNAETGQCMCEDVSEAPSSSPSAQPTPYSTSPGSEDEELLGEPTGSKYHGDSNSTGFLPDIMETSDEEGAIRYIPCKIASQPTLLSDVYVKRAKDLVDTPVDFFTRTFRVFASMDTGDVIGFLAFSFVLVFGAGIGAMGVAKAYKRKSRSGEDNATNDDSFSSAATSPASLRLRRNTFSFSVPDIGVPRFRLTFGNVETHRTNRRRPDTRADERLRRPSQRRRQPRNAFRTNKDKAVATMLFDLRINDSVRKTRQRRRDLLLRRQRHRRREIQERVRHLPARVSSQDYAPTGESVVRHSELPPLPQGERVVAVVGAVFIDDVPDEDTTDRNIDVASLAPTDSSEHVTDATSFGGTELSGANSASSASGADATVDNERARTDGEFVTGNRGTNNPMMPYDFSSGGSPVALRKRRDKKMS